MIEFAAKIAARADRAEIRENARDKEETRKIKGYDVSVEVRTRPPDAH